MGLNPDGLARAEGYAETMNSIVLPRIAAARHDGIIEGDGGRPLFVSRFDAEEARGTVLIVHGFTENADKFSEIIHSLLQNRLSVVAYDQRGHGRSWRDEALDDVSLTHVDDFDEYVRDLKLVIRRVLASMPRPHRVLCHSMGGAVTALLLESEPDAFDRAVMCAPMIAPALNGIPKPAARLMCRSAIAMGQGKKRIVGSSPYAGPEDFATAAANGRERFEWYEGLRTANPVFQNNGPTYGWTLQAIDVTDRILAPGAVERIEAEVRLYTAALDGSVLPEPQGDFIRRVKRGVHVTVEGTKHEIYRAPDDVLFLWWHEALSFLAGE